MRLYGKKLMTTTKNWLLWICRIVAAGIMLQTLFFKFTGAEESVYIFSTLHAEPWGRIATGVLELIAGALILVPRTTWLGALLGAGIMGGALCSHIFVLGIEVMNDGGQLFVYALLVMIACAVLLYAEKEKWLHHIPFSIYTQKGVTQ